MNTKQRIREFILRNFYVADGYPLEDELSLIDAGIVDSTGVLELVTFLEVSFGIRVADQDIVPTNLDSIARMAAFVDHRLASTAPRR